VPKKNVLVKDLYRMNRIDRIKSSGKSPYVLYIL